MKLLVSAYVCRECRAEYRSGFTRCADCDVDLVQELHGRDLPKFGTQRAASIRSHFFSGNIG
jgi:hypothetical protein